MNSIKQASYLFSKTAAGFATSATKFLQTAPKSMRPGLAPRFLAAPDKFLPEDPVLRSNVIEGLNGQLHHLLGPHKARVKPGADWPRDPQILRKLQLEKARIRQNLFNEGRGTPEFLDRSWSEHVKKEGLRRALFLAGYGQNPAVRTARQIALMERRLAAGARA